MEEKVIKFWSLYDRYIKNPDENLRPSLSDLLAQIEQSNRETQLIRPKKCWDKIIAWQVLRNQRFLLGNGNHFYLEAGEILAWTPHWDRDVFITRIPHEEWVSGSILRPGYHFNEDDFERLTSEGKDAAEQTITDERGLYLPLYDFETVIMLSNNYIEKSKKQIIKFLREEKGYQL